MTKATTDTRSFRLRAFFCIGLAWCTLLPSTWAAPAGLPLRQLMPLLQQLQHNDPQRRISAVRKLARYQGKAQVVLVALARSMVDSNQVVRFLAGRQIIRWGPGALAYMRPALDHPSHKVRWSAAFALSQIQPKTAVLRSVLLVLLRNKSYRARGAAIQGLHDGKRPSLRVWQALARQIAWDIHPINRIYCLHALITRPKRAQPIFLKVMATDRHPLVRRRAASLLVASALPKVAIDGALRVRLVKEHDEVVKLAFLHLWGKLYKSGQVKADAILPILKGLFKAKLWTLREAAFLQVGRLQQKGKKLLPALRRQKDPRPEVQQAIKQAIALLEKPATSASKPTTVPVQRRPASKQPIVRATTRKAPTPASRSVPQRR